MSMQKFSESSGDGCFQTCDIRNELRNFSVVEKSMDEKVEMRWLSWHSDVKMNEARVGKKVC